MFGYTSNIHMFRREFDTLQSHYRLSTVGLSLGGRLPCPAELDGSDDKPVTSWHSSLTCTLRLSLLAVKATCPDNRL